MCGLRKESGGDSVYCERILIFWIEFKGSNADGKTEFAVRIVPVDIPGVLFYGLLGKEGCAVCLVRKNDADSERG